MDLKETQNRHKMDSNETQKWTQKRLKNGLNWT